MHYKSAIIPVAVRIISTWLLRFFFLSFKRLTLSHRVLCQGLAVSTGSNLTGKCVIIAIVEGWCRRSEQKKKKRRRRARDKTVEKARAGWFP